MTLDIQSGAIGWGSMVMGVYVWKNYFFILIQIFHNQRNSN